MHNHRDDGIHNVLHCRLVRWEEGIQSESLRLIVLVVLGVYALSNPLTYQLALGLFIYVALNLIALPALKPSIN